MKLEELQKIQTQRHKSALRVAKEKAEEEKLRLSKEREAKFEQVLKSRHQQKPSLGVFSPLHKVEKRCPKLAEHYTGNKEFSRAIDILMQQSPIRKLEDWKTQGKSVITLFNSLANHLLAKYRVPQMLWTTFFFDKQGSEKLIKLAVHVASGGSLYKWIKDNEFQIPLTRKACHEFLSGPDPDKGIIENMRCAQLLCLGGNGRLWKALEPVAWSSQFSPNASWEEFYSSIIQWLGLQAMLDMRQVQPMWDYATNQRNGDTNWSIKGRNAVSLIRDMELWHANLQKVKVAGHKAFMPSGFLSATYTFPNHDVWRIREILSARELADEGRRQGHCVYSYSRQIESGHCSIWTLTKEDETGNWAMLTIEVVNGAKQITQARGRFNRCSNQMERSILNRWATESGLTLAGYL